MEGGARRGNIQMTRLIRQLEQAIEMVDRENQRERAMTESQRKATAAFHDKMTRAFKQHGKPKNADAARKAAEKCRKAK